MALQTYYSGAFVKVPTRFTINITKEKTKCPNGHYSNLVAGNYCQHCGSKMESFVEVEGKEIDLNEILVRAGVDENMRGLKDGEYYCPDGDQKFLIYDCSVHNWRTQIALLFDKKINVKHETTHITIDIQTATKQIEEFKTTYAEDIKKLEAFYGIELKVEFGVYSSED